MNIDLDEIEKIFKIRRVFICTNEEVEEHLKACWSREYYDKAGKYLVEFSWTDPRVYDDSYWNSPDLNLDESLIEFATTEHGDSFSEVVLTCCKIFERSRVEGYVDDIWETFTEEDKEAYHKFWKRYE